MDVCPRCGEVFKREKWTINFCDPCVNQVIDEKIKEKMAEDRELTISTEKASMDVCSRCGMKYRKWPLDNQLCSECARLEIQESVHDPLVFDVGNLPLPISQIGFEFVGKRIDPSSPVFEIENTSPTLSAASETWYRAMLEASRKRMETVHKRIIQWWMEDIEAKILGGGDDVKPDHEVTNEW